jgi:hypothetical protein
VRAIVLVGTKDGLFELGATGQSHLPGRRISAIAGHRCDWWVAVDDREIWHAGVQGRWQRVAECAEHAVTCLLRGPSGILVGTAGAHLFRLRGRTLQPVKSFDAVADRGRWYTPWGDPADTRSLTADAAGRVFVNVHVGGIVRSVGAVGNREGRRAWQPTVDIETDVHQVLAHPTVPGMVFAAAAVGFGTSPDGGSTWSFTAEGFHAPYLRAVAVARAGVVVSASGGPQSRRAALYRRPLGSAAPFERCRAGLPEWFHENIDTYCLAAVASTVIAGTHDGVVFRSGDAGHRWSVLADRLPSISCLAVSN